jgi:predicted MFS family arabinose efflux permease
MLVLLLLDLVEPWHAYVVVFITGLADVTDFSARRSYYAEILDQPTFLNAVSLHAASAMGSNMIGPAIGGMLIATAGYGGAYGFMIAMYVCAAVLISAARASTPIARPQGAPQGPLTQVREALTMMRRNRTVRAALLVTVTLNFCAFPYMAMVSVIARDVLHVGEVPYGFLAAASGLGAFVGALVIASRTVRSHGTVYIIGSSMLMACVFLFGLSSFYPLSLLALIASGLGQSGFASMQAAMVLLAVGPEMRGRAMGAVALAIGASPFGSLAVGQLAALLGPQRALMVLAGVGFAILMFLRWWFPELRGRKPEPQEAQVAEPKTA